MRSVVRRALAVLLVGFVVGGVAARWPAAMVAAQTEPSTSPTPPPTVSGSKVTAAPTTTAPRPATTAARGTAAQAPNTAAPNTAAPRSAATTAVTVPATTAPVPSAAPTTIAVTGAPLSTVASAATTATTLVASTTAAAASTVATSATPRTTTGIGDAEASRKVRRISWTLVALAGGLMALTLWFWRATRPVPAELGGLAVMGTRRWRRLPVTRRDELVTGSRPTRLGDGDELFVDPADVPALVLRDVRASALVPAAPPADAPLAEAPPAGFAMANVAPRDGDVVSMFEVLPGAGPMTVADLGSFDGPPSPVPLPPSARVAAPDEVALSASLVPTALPAHLVAHSTSAVMSPPSSLVSEGSSTAVPRASPLDADAPAFVPVEPPPPVMPVELSPAIDGLSPLVEVVTSPDPGSLALEPIPAEQFVSGPAGEKPPQ